MLRSRGRISHVLFDMDGLLLDTERIYSMASTSILASYGKEYPFELKAKLMGGRPREVVAAIIEHTGVPLTVDEYMALGAVKKEQMLPTCKFMPGVPKLLHHLFKVGKKRDSCHVTQETISVLNRTTSRLAWPRAPVARTST